MGTIEIDNCTAAVYKVPFPVNNNVEDRHLYYLNCSIDTP